MNRIYKVIWSKARNCYVAVSEMAKNNSKGSVRSERRGLIKGVSALALCFALSVGISSSAWAESYYLPAWWWDGTPNSNSIVAIGSNGNRIHGGNNTAVGVNTQIGYGWANVAIGQGSVVDGWYSVAVGDASKVSSGDYNTAVGQGSEITGGGNNTAYGAGSHTGASFNNVAIGPESFAGGGSPFGTMGSPTVNPLDSSTGTLDPNSWRGALSGRVGTYYSSIGKDPGAELGRLQAPTWQGGAGLTQLEAVKEMEFQVWLNDEHFATTGNGTQFTGDYNTALGSGARANGRGETAIGGGAWATGGHSTAVGVGARASGLVSTAIGQSSRAEQAGTIAIGDRASVLNTDWSYHIPVDTGSTEEIPLPSTNAIAIGSEARALSRDTTTVGRYSQALMPTSTAYGNNSHANGQVSIAIGNKATAGYESDIFYLDIKTDEYGNYVKDNDGKYVYEITGVKDPMAGDSSIAMGNRATAVDRSDVAIGTSSYTEGRSSVTVGEQGRATGEYSIAIGGGKAMYQILNADNVPEPGNPHTENARYYGLVEVNQASGDYSTGVGYNNKTVGDSSSALGKENAVTGTGSFAAGSGNKIGTVQYVPLSSTVILPDGTDTGVSLVPDGYEGGMEQYQIDAAEGKITGLVLDKDQQEDKVTGYAVGTDNEIMSFKTAESGGNAGESGDQTGGDGTGTTGDGTGADAGEQTGGEGNNEQTGRSYAGAYGHKNIVYGENGYATGNENKINQGADNALAIGIGNVLGVEPAAEEESDDGDGTDTTDEGGDNNNAASTAGKNSIAMGNKNTVIGEDSIAIGMGHIVKGKGSGAIGDPNKVNGNSSYILGNNSEIGAISSGDAAEDQGETSEEIAVDNAFIIGNDSKIVDENAKGGLIFGSNAEVTAENGLALGNNTNVTLADSVALGSYALAKEKRGYEDPAENDVEVGDLTYSSSRFAGTGEEVIGTVSVGGVGKVRTVTNVAAGIIDAESTDAINGSQLYAVYDQLPWKVGIGKDGGTNGTDDVGALEQSVVWKQDEKNDKSNVQFIAGKGIDISHVERDDGYGIKVSNLIDFTTENGKVTEVIYGDETYKVGGDEIDTDNRVVGLRVENDKQKIISPFIEIDGIKGATEDANVDSEYAQAKGENSIAIGSEAKAHAKDSIALGVGAEAYGEQTVAIGMRAKAGDPTDESKIGAVAIGGKAVSTGEFSVAMQNGKATGDYATAFGINTTASGAQATAFGEESVASGKNSTAFGSNSHASAENSLAALGGNVVDVATNSAAIGKGAQVTVADTVALGSDSKAATEAGEIGYDILLDGPSKEENNPIWQATRNAIAVGDSSNNITRQITGVAAGTKDTDAVNVAQLKLLRDAMENMEQEASAHSTVTVDGSEVDKDVTDGNLLLTVTKEDGKGTNYDLKLNNQLDLGDDGSITMGDTKIEGDSITVGDTKIDGDSITANTVNGDTVNADTVNAETVNTETIQLGDEGNSTTITYDGDRINYGDKVVATTEDGLDFAGDDGNVIQKKLTEQLEVVGGAADKASEYNIYTYKDGEQLRINLAKDIKGVDTVAVNDKITVGDNTTITGDEVTTKTVNADTFKAGDTTVNGDGLTIKDGPKVTKDGIDAGGNKITNVAKGTEDDDAVNYSQLKDVMNQSGDTFNNLNNKINRMDSKIEKVGAGAAALAGLHPLDFDPDEKWHVAAGIGNYGSETAVALGAFYQPTDDILYNVATTVGDGRNMVSGGVSIRFGQKSHQSRSKKAMAKEIIELREEVAELKALVYDLTGKGGLDPSKTAVFPDTPENHWAYDYVAVLAGNGVLEGYQDGYFKGNRQLTRYEMAAIIYRLMSKGVEVDNRMLQEFAPELARVKVDTLTHYNDGTPHIQRVRIIPQRG